MLLHTGESNTVSIEDDASRHGINIRILLQKQKGLGIHVAGMGGMDNCVMQIPGDAASRDGMQSSSAAALGRGGRAHPSVACGSSAVGQQQCGLSGASSAAPDVLLFRLSGN